MASCSAQLLDLPFGGSDCACANLPKHWRIRAPYLGNEPGKRLWEEIMKNMARMFILTGILFLVTGMAFGLYMAEGEDVRFIPVHAHLNLLGFVLMFLFGLAYQVWPKMQEGLLCRIHYFLHVVGVIVSMLALYVILQDPAANGETLGPVATGAAAMTLVGVLIFAFLFSTKAND